LGIAAYFQAVVSLHDLGMRPTDPQAYRAAATAMELEVSEMAFMGHDAAELAGAAAAGMRTIAFNHDAAAEADVYLDRFGQLIQVLSGPPRRRQAG
jgi:FMN phosphatase YigB (HAD superfamily)